MVGMVARFYRDAPRRGARSAVVCRTKDAQYAEDELTRDGRCNWLTDYGNGEQEYCGAPCDGVLCSDHAWKLK